MKITYDGQLLTAELTVGFRGKTLRIPDIIIDTGSSHTVFSPDVLEQIGVTYENGDPVTKRTELAAPFIFIQR